MVNKTERKQAPLWILDAAVLDLWRGCGWGGGYTFLDNDAFTGSEFTARPVLLQSECVFMRVHLSEDTDGSKQFSKSMFRANFLGVNNSIVSVSHRHYSKLCDPTNTGCN